MGYLLVSVIVAALVVAHTTNVIWRRKRNGQRGRYMMATVAIHQLGDISRATPSLCLIQRQGLLNYYGHWVTGLGFVEVRFPKKTTRPLTQEERAQYRGKWVEINGCPLYEINV